MKKGLVVITGGTKGIGRAIIRKFADGGYDVATCARNQNELAKLKVEIEAAFMTDVHIQKCDISKKTEAKKFGEFVKDLKKPIDALFNNAGSFLPGTIAEEEEGTFESMLEVNLHSAYFLTRELLPEFKKQKSGHIFNMCSTASFTPYTNGGSYCISKFALYGMSKVLREELKQDQVRVTSVLPGATLTASWEGTELPSSRFMKPGDVADMVWATYNLSAQSVVEDLIIRPQLGDL